MSGVMNLNVRLLQYHINFERKIIIIIIIWFGDTVTVTQPYKM